METEEKRASETRHRIDTAQKWIYTIYEESETDVYASNKRHLQLWKNAKGENIFLYWTPNKY